MKKSILTSKSKVLRTLERVVLRQRKKGFQISMTLFTPRQIGGTGRRRKS